MAVRQLLPSNDEIDLAVKQVRLHRRPFVTLTEAVEEISRAALPPEDTGWYVAYERMRRKSPRDLAKFQPHFNYVVSVELETAKYIVDRFAEPSNRFLQEARLLYRRNPHGPLQAASLKEIEAGLRPNRTAEFLLAAYQLLHTFRGEVDFIEGRVHEMLGTRSHSDRWLWVKTIPNGTLPDIEIFDLLGNPLSGRLVQQSKGKDASDRALVNWLLFRRPPEWIATMPVYDGPPREATLRGFFSFPCKEDAKTALARYLNDHYERIQTRLTGAYWEGMRRYILDSFDEDRTYADNAFWCVDDPAQYWINQMLTFFGWRKAPRRQQPENSPYRIAQRRADIFVDKVLRNIEHVLGSAMTSREIADLADRHRGSIFLEYPSDNSPESQPYLLRHVHTAINLLNDILQKREMLVQRRNALIAARRAAMAAIMARNMSHNIGSHVLARLAIEEQIPPPVEDLSLVGLKYAHAVPTYEKYTPVKKLPKDQQDEILPELSAELKKVKQPIARLNSYLRTRMDLLADMATPTSPLYSSKSLYSEVLAFFRPGEAELDDYPWPELLVDHISGTDLGAGHITVNVDNTSQPDPAVAFPNDMLGAHALYVILENVIRNCAKHAGASTLDLQLAVEVTSPAKARAGSNLIKVTLNDGLGTCRTRLVKELNASIKMGLLPDGAPRQQHWGVMEMRSAAAYLRGVAPEAVDDEHKPPLLRACKVNGSLGYTFYLRRAREVLVLDFGQMVRGDIVRALRSSAVEVIGEASLDDLQKVYAHSFAVVLCASRQQLDQLPWNSPGLPRRRLAFIQDAADRSALPRDVLPWTDLESAFSGEVDGNAIVNTVWHHWTKVKHGDAIPSVVRRIGASSTNLISGSSGNTIIFDNHGENWTDMGSEPSCLYYDPFPSASSIGRLILNVDGNGSRLCYEALDSALLRVGVIDERIQKTIEQQRFRLPARDGRQGLKVPMYMVLARTNVRIPTLRDVDLNAKEFHTEHNRLDQWIAESAEDLEFLVIHLGIIEKRLNSTSRSKIEDWIDQIRGEYPTLVLVITSGRGNPPNLPDNAPFVHDSVVSRYILEDRSKLHLGRILHATRGGPVWTDH